MDRSAGVGAERSVARTTAISIFGRRAGERAMASMSRFLTQKLRLKVNEAKSAVARLLLEGIDQRRWVGRWIR
jgi:hypothetical protein